MTKAALAQIVLTAKVEALVWAARRLCGSEPPNNRKMRAQLEILGAEIFRLKTARAAIEAAKEKR